MEIESRNAGRNSRCLATNPVDPRGAGTKTESAPGSDGFTLLETLAALSILSIVLIGVYTLQGQTIAMGNSAGFYAEAPLLANAILSDFDAAVAQDRFQDGDSGRLEEPFDGYRWAVSIQSAGEELPGEIAKDFIKLTIEIERTEDERTFALVAYRFLRPQ
jgi:prepilin-type N-terminal cleavage/methylation domain-containing protein